MPYAVAAAAIAAGGAAYSADQSKQAAGQQVGASNQAIQAQTNQANVSRTDNAPFLRTGTAANQRLMQLLGLSTAAPAGAKAILRDNQAFDEQGNYLGRFGIDQGAMTLGQIAPTWGVNSVVDESGNAVWTKPGTESAAPATFDPNASPLLRKFTADDLANDPVYNSGLKFGADQGRDAINARAQQAGNYDSGATLKALTRFGTDYGSTKASDSYNRFTNDQNNVFNRLSGISGTGQVASSQVSASGANATNNIGASLEGAGNARAAGIVGGANAWGNAGASTNSAINNYQNNQLLQQLLAQNKGGTNTAPSGGYYAGIDT